MALEQAEAIHALWAPLVDRFNPPQGSYRARRELEPLTGDLEAFRVRVDLWHRRLDLEEIEDSPLELLIDMLDGVE